MRLALSLAVLVNKTNRIDIHGYESIQVLGIEKYPFLPSAYRCTKEDDSRRHGWSRQAIPAPD
jgi:hypothetical protein